MQVIIGSDPEVFVHNGKEFIPAHNLIPGTKEAPHVLDCGAVQVDGLALEFNSIPADTEEKFVSNIYSVFNELQKMVPEFKLMTVPVADFSKEVFNSLPDEAKVMGCDPDFNAWKDGQMNDVPDGDRLFRTAAGHIHVGWTEGEDINDLPHFMSCVAITKQLDFYLGLPSVIFDRDTRRRELYGKAGAFRPKHYGVEYRVLSNVWLSDEKYIKWVFRATNRAVADMLDGRVLADMEGDISNIINTSDAKAAFSIIQKYGLEFI